MEALLQSNQWRKTLVQAILCSVDGIGGTYIPGSTTKQLMCDRKTSLHDGAIDNVMCDTGTEING